MGRRQCPRRRASCWCGGAGAVPDRPSDRCGRLAVRVRRDRRHRGLPDALPQQRPPRRHAGTCGGLNGQTDAPPARRAEFLGTFWLVFGGCGSAVLAAGFADSPSASASSASRLAFGLTVAHHGLRRRPHLRRPLQPGRHPRAGRRRAVRVAGRAAVRRRAGPRRHRRGRRPWVIASGWPGFAARPAASPPTATATTRRAATRCSPCLRHRGRAHRVLPAVIMGPPTPGPAGFAPLAIGLSLTLIHLCQHPGDQHVGEPGPVDRARRSSPARRRSASCGCSGSRRWSAARWRASSTPGCWAASPRRPRCRRRPRRERRSAAALGPDDSPPTGEDPRRGGRPSVSRTVAHGCGDRRRRARATEHPPDRPAAGATMTGSERRRVQLALWRWATRVSALLGLGVPWSSGAGRGRWWR